jgi:RNA-directed DNA polymerase
MWLIRLVLSNHKSDIKGKGMPLGNLTSQFFANVYLNELDRFVKHELKVKYYIRYVDDFIIFHRDKTLLESWKAQINQFLLRKLKIEQHPEKSRIMPLEKGITFLGFRVFHNYKLLKKSNTRRIWKRLEIFRKRYKNGTISQNKIASSIEGWFAYSKFANTYNLRKRVALCANEIFL